MYNKKYPLGLKFIMEDLGRGTTKFVISDRSNYISKIYTNDKNFTKAFRKEFENNYGKFL